LLKFGGIFPPFPQINYKTQQTSPDPNPNPPNCRGKKEIKKAKGN
jgi:hypothetical protein